MYARTATDSGEHTELPEGGIEMPPVELDNNVIDILNRIVAREELESPSDAIRFLDNGYTLQKAVILKMDTEIRQLEVEIERLKFELKAAGDLST